MLFRSGGALEKLAGKLYEERSRKGIGDFPITHRVQGFWDKSDTEIDLVAVNETEQLIRFGCCKRSPNTEKTSSTTWSKPVCPTIGHNLKPARTLFDFRAANAH